MKIKEIKIKWFRSIKEELIIKDFWNLLSLVWKNNSGKSSVINTLRLFWWDITLNKNDFTYCWTNTINISILFSDIDKSSLFKSSLLTSVQKASLVNNFKDNFSKLQPLNNWEIFEKIERLDLEDDELDFLYDKFIELLKIEINSDNNILINYIASLAWEDISIHYIKESWDEDKNFFKKEWKPTLLFIWDDRNFEEEENSSKWSLTAQLIQDLDIKKESTGLSSASTVDLTIEDLEKIIEKKFESETKKIWYSISNYFKEFYKSDFDEVKLNPQYWWINNSNFKIKSEIKDPITWKFISLNNLWAWLRSIYILSLLKSYNDIKKWSNTIILIEEPELYLHPELQKIMSWTLSEISKDHTVLFTTHSPLLLNTLSIENIKNIYFDDTLKTTKLQDANMEIICNDLWYSSLDMINKEKILFVEGTSDIRVFSKIIDKFYNWILDKIKILSIWWCWNLPQYATLNFTWESPMLIDNSIIILDRDYYPPKTSTVNSDSNRVNFFKAWLKKIIESDIVDNYKEDIMFITEWHSLENLFLDFDLINLIFSWINLSESMLRLEFRNFANHHDYIHKLQKNYNKIKDIPCFFDNIENRNLELKNIRWHNLMDYLLYKCYWEDYNNITNENEIDFCDKYIDASNNSNFSWLLEFFNKLEIFYDNKI